MYVGIEDNIFFNSEFNGSLDLNIDLISKYNKIIFCGSDMISPFIEENIISKENIINKENLRKTYGNENTYFLDNFCFGHSKFNQPVDTLPKSITHIFFGRCFNHPVNMLPPSIKLLTFGWNFNQKVNMLPKLLKYLTFSFSFNHSIDLLPNIQNI